MKKPLHSFFLFVGLLLSFAPLWSQSHISRQIAELEQDFRSFNYEKVLEKGNFLLADPYVTKSDSLQILKYMLNSAYALADTTQAKKIIHQILKCDANFTLTPVDTSPKIIEFFEHVKKQVKSNKPVVPFKPQIRTVIKPVALPWQSTFLTLLFPGTGHLHQKIKKKGYLYTGVSAALLSGVVYATIQTNVKKTDYLSAKPGADFNRLYDDYNTMFKIRNFLWATFFVWDLYVFYDLQKSWNVRVNSQLKGDGFGFQVSWNW